MIDFEYKMVIITRSDLKLSPGKLAAQVAHAAVACALDTKKINS
jgi:PTH2 family peptidyl-tRNA hydrolase